MNKKKKHVERLLKADIDKVIWYSLDKDGISKRDTQTTYEDLANKYHLSLKKVKEIAKFEMEVSEEQMLLNAYKDNPKKEVTRADRLDIKHHMQNIRKQLNGSN